MRLFLIRHGETVDNVAGLYAGSRDSALTNHGVEQARRLGAYMAANRPELTRVFASPLQRAHKTANALASAQSSGLVTVVDVPELVEQDFGYYEGKPFSARSRDASKSSKQAQGDAHKSDPGFVDVESKDSLARRSDLFLDHHLLPLLSDEADFGDEAEHVIVVVSHGILLSHLWRRLLLRLQPKSVVISPEVIASRGQVVLEHLGGWSNTGFLELSIQRVGPVTRSEIDKAVTDSVEPSITKTTDADESPSGEHIVVPAVNLPSQDVSGSSETELPASQSDPVGDVSVTNHAIDTRPSENSVLDGYRTTVLAIDGKQHLVGLKRTRGGIGRAEHDEKQKTMDSFFKRARRD